MHKRIYILHGNKNTEKAINKDRAIWDLELKQAGEESKEEVGGVEDGKSICLRTKQRDPKLLMREGSKGKCGGNKARSMESEESVSAGKSRNRVCEVRAGSRTVLF